MRPEFLECNKLPNDAVLLNQRLYFEHETKAFLHDLPWEVKVISPTHMEFLSHDYGKDTVKRKCSPQF